MKAAVSLLACLVVLPAALTAQDDAAPWLSEVAARVRTHFGLEGDLLLSTVGGGALGMKPDSKVTIVEFPAAISPQFPIRLRVENGQPGKQDLSVVMRANLWRSGWKLRQPAQRGDLLDPGMLEEVRFDALRDREAVTELPTGNQVFSRAVQKDRLLTWRDLAARPDVRRGQMVEVVAQSGSVSVSLKGLAMQDGTRNEIIRIRNLQSNREFSAEVTGPNRAIIRL